MATMPSRSRATREVLPRYLRPPLAAMAGCLRSFVRSRDRVNGGGVLPAPARRPAAARHWGRTLTDDRVVDQIGCQRYSATLGRCRVTNLITQLTPGRPPVIPVTDGICGAQEAGNRVPYRFVDNDPISACLNEWKIEQSMGSCSTVAVQHRGQDRLGRTTYDARCLKRLSSDRILDIGEVQRRRSSITRDMAASSSPARGFPGHRQKRAPTRADGLVQCDSVEPLRRRDAPPLEQLERIRLIERPQREFMEALNTHHPATGRSRQASTRPTSAGRSGTRV